MLFGILCQVCSKKHETEQLHYTYVYLPTLCTAYCL